MQNTLLNCMNKAVARIGERNTLGEEVMKKTIEELRQQQEVTVGASDWYRLEEEIQELLDEEENANNK